METIEFEYENEDGDTEVVELPAYYEVCPRCEGKGKHVNPSIDEHGITEEEWEHDWDEESREAYLSGRYDVTCHECGGKRVVKVVDEDWIKRSGSAEQKRWLKAYFRMQRALEDEQISRMERMRGA